MHKRIRETSNIKPRYKKAKVEVCYIEFIKFIISYINATRLLEYRLVCKYWNEIIKKYKKEITITCCNDISLERYISIFNNILELKLMGKFKRSSLEKLGNLRKLSINKLGLNSLYVCDTLRNLKINMYRGETTCLRNAYEQIAKSKVNKLTIANKDSYCNHCLEEYRKFNNITSIKLINYVHIDKDIIETIMRLPKLNKLILYNCVFTFCPKMWKQYKTSSIKIIINKSTYDVDIRKKLEHITFI